MEKLNNQIDEKNKEISSLKNEVSDLTNEKSKIFWEDKALSERYYSKDKIANEKNNEIDTKNQELLNLKNKYSSLNMEVISLKNGNYNVYYNTVDPMKYLLFYYIGAGIAGVSILIALIYFLITRKK